MRDWVGNKAYPDVKTLARSAQGLERMIGAERAGRLVALPAEEFNDKGELVKQDAEGRKAFNAKMGVPESADKYDIPQDPAFPEFKAEFSKVLFANHVPARMATALAKGFDQVMAQAVAANEAREKAASEAGVLELQRTWGSAFKENTQHASRAEQWIMKETGASELQMKQMEALLGTSKYMGMLSKIGAGNAESRFAGTANNNTGGDSGGGFARNASDAQARINQITADRSSGKITDFQWRETYEKEMIELGKIVAAGHASAA